MEVPANARGAVRTSTFWGEGSEAARSRWRSGWWDAYDDPQRLAVGLAGDEAYQRGRAEYLDLFAPRSPSVSTEAEPLRICGIPLEHSAGFVWAATVCGFHIRFHADRDGTSVAIARSTPSGPPLHEERGETHELVAEAMGRWIEKKTGHTATPAGDGARRNPMKLIERPIAELRDHPLNPRIRSSESVAEMKASIERHGLLQPLVIKPDGTVLLGHRRRWALEELGRESAPCYVTDGESEAKSIELLIIGNEHVERPDPLRESEAVAQLLAQPGWNVKTVADALGRSMHWVARRARLKDLSPTARAARSDTKHPLASWPAEWLEELAVLAPDAQDKVLRDRNRVTWLRDIADVRRIIGEEVKGLSAAPWDLEDQVLVPKAGACSTCPKTTAKQPGLFPDDTEVEGRELKRARCLDSGCWAKKLNAHVSAGISAVREELCDPKATVIAEAGITGLKAVTGAGAIRDYQVDVVKGSVKGAKAAVLVKADGTVKNVFVAKGVRAGPSTRAPAEKKPAMSEAEKLKQSKLEIKGRRLRHVNDAVAAVIDEGKVTPSYEDVRLLVLAFGAESNRKSHSMRDLEKLKRTASDDLAWAREIWSQARMLVADMLGPYAFANGESADLGRWLAPKLGLDLAALDAKAKEEIPDPAWWPGKKTKTPKAKAAAESGTCSKCGCTWNTPCVSGDASDACHWIDKEQTKCSACFTDRHGTERVTTKAKKTKAKKARK